MNMVTTLALRPLTDVKQAMKGVADLDSQMTELRGKMLNPDKDAKKKKDKLFDAAFTKEGVAGDFQGGFQQLLYWLSKRCNCSCA